MENNNSAFHIQSFGDRHPGRRRKNNEDVVTWFEPMDPLKIEASGSLYILADGVGGAAKGERASQYAAQKVLHEYYQHPDVEAGERLRQLMMQANNDIFTHTEQSGQYRRMATTMVAAIVRAGKLIVANVGDSRAYLIREGKTSQLTRDHSIVGEMVANGDMTEADAQASKVKNRLTRSLGGEAEVHVDVHPAIQLQAGDRILLCSDGLTRYTRREDIAKMTTNGSPKEIVGRLIKFANQHGGADNISVILISVNNDQPTPSTALPGDDVGETEIPAHRRIGRGILDMEDEEETELGRGMRDDVTELEVATSGGPLAMLWVKKGPRRGKFYPIRHGTVIGRKEGNLILDDPKVSGSHAKFTMEKEDIFIWDFGSANGTYVNERRIREATLIYENDRIKIGDTVFVVKLLELDTNNQESIKKRTSLENRDETKKREPIEELKSFDAIDPFEGMESFEEIDSLEEIESFEEVDDTKPPKKTKHFNISIAYPLCLAKKFASVFLFHFYLPIPKYRAHVEKEINSEFQEQKLGMPINRASMIEMGQKIKVQLSNPNFLFSDSGIKVVDDPVNKITFLVMPNESCEPGSHKILVSISDAETDQEFESVAINVQVVDFAFDHVSRPLLSRVTAVVLGIGSFAMFVLALLEQIDKTVGLTSGTAAGVLAAVVYANFYNLYQRVRPNTP